MLIIIEFSQNDSGMNWKASRARYPPPLVQFPAITICAFIPRAEFCSFNALKTSPAKSSVGMFFVCLVFQAYESSQAVYYECA